MNFITRLNDYIEEVRTRPFVWGTNDCLVFTNTAFERMYGQGYADDWLGTYYKNSRNVPIKELKKAFPYKNLKEAIDDKLQPKTIPTVGDLVLTKKTASNVWYVGAALGICIGNKAAFVGMNKLQFFPLDVVDYTWGVK
jgi:hypothetical protein